MVPSCHVISTEGVRWALRFLHPSAVITRRGSLRAPIRPERDSLFIALPALFLSLYLSLDLSFSFSFYSFLFSPKFRSPGCSSRSILTHESFHFLALKWRLVSSPSIRETTPVKMEILRWIPPPLIIVICWLNPTSTSKNLISSFDEKLSPRSRSPLLYIPSSMSVYLSLILSTYLPVHFTRINCYRRSETIHKSRESAHTETSNADQFSIV